MKVKFKTRASYLEKKKVFLIKLMKLLGVIMSQRVDFLRVTAFSVGLVTGTS